MEPLPAKAVLEHCYMDDLVPSASTVDEAKETRRQLTQLGNQAGFHIQKWVSTNMDVIADIKEEDRASDIDLEKRELPTIKTLGVLWSATDDKFFFLHSLQLDGFEFTQRKVLKKAATVYDPLGFLLHGQKQGHGTICCQNIISKNGFSGFKSWMTVN